MKLSRPPERTILEACIEVGRPVVFAVSIIMIVYLPILTLTGIEGKMFKPMALTVVFALLGSLILSLTYVTAAMTYLLRGHVSERESFVIRFAKRHYQTVLAYVTGRRRAALIIASALVLLSVAIFPWLGSEFIPRLDEGAFAVQIHQMADVDWCSIVAHFFALDCTRSVSPGKGVANRNRH
ncbi:MAG TPA: efflux RND transporter permease subunit [Pyrinomonadaceae bacterium]|nr:efflux RND transporter permease subunit [Pyrinomonadaceae bacterium]